MTRSFGFSLLGLCLAAVQAGAATAGGNRGYSAGKYALELDGQFEGFLQGVQMSGSQAGVHEHGSGPDRIRTKSVGNLKGTDITLKLDLPLAHGLHEWVRQMVSGGSSSKSGALLSLDFNDTVKHSREFNEARIGQVTFPAVEAGGKDRGTFLVKIAPETTRDSKGSGTSYKADGANKQKEWLPSNFKLTIDGLEGACQRVDKIAAIVVRQKVSRSQDGAAPRKSGPASGYSTLVVTFSGQQAQALNQWRQGARGAGDRGGSLAYLAPDLKQTLLTLDFTGLTLLSVAQDKAGGKGAAPSRVKAVFRFTGITMSEAKLQG